MTEILSAIAVIILLFVCGHKHNKVKFYKKCSELWKENFTLQTQEEQKLKHEIAVYKKNLELEKETNLSLLLQLRGKK